MTEDSMPSKLLVGAAVVMSIMRQILWFTILIMLAYGLYRWLF